MTERDRDRKPSDERDTAHGHSVLRSLSAKGLKASRVMLRDDSSGNAPLVNTRSADVLRHSSERYQMIGEIARGGMGVVLKGRDVDLGRDVAMKVLLEEFKDRGDVLQRFVEEAQIGGQLQHPGIVPVYEMGLQPDGRPYFTMKLVKGRTLADLLADRKSPLDGRRRLIAIFEAVCQTLSYAHARGVFHRDLKPSNVMVGAFGQVFVVDWGLAKVRGREREDAAPEEPEPMDPMTIIATVRSESHSADSLVGSIMGTPAYMAPEQARGEVGSLDQRTDVFALGAILCEILTGAPPFTGTDREAVLDASRGRLVDAHQRLDAAEADPELVSLAKACLAPAPAARPPDASAVVDALAEYLGHGEERERAIEAEASAQRVRAEEARRAHRLTRWLAVSLLISLALAGGAWGWMRLDEAALEAATARQFDASMGAATFLQSSAEADGSLDTWAEAESAAKYALALAQSPGAGADQLARATRVLTRVSADREKAVAAAAFEVRDAETLRALDAIRLRSLLRPGESVEQAYAEAFEAYGLDVGTSDRAQAIASVRTSRIGLPIAHALAHWTRERRAQGSPEGHLMALAGIVDGDPWRCMLRTAQDLTKLRALEAITVIANLRPAELIELAAVHEDMGETLRAGRLLAVAVERFPDDFWAQVAFAAHLRGARMVPRPPPTGNDALFGRARELMPLYSAKPAWEEGLLAPGFLSDEFGPPKMRKVYADAFALSGKPVHLEVLARRSDRRAIFEYLFADGASQAVVLAVEQDAPHRLTSAVWDDVRSPHPERTHRADAWPNSVAIRHLTAAAALRPNDDGVRIALAEALADDADPDGAEALLGGVLERSPLDAAATLAMGAVQIERRQFDTAAETVRAVVAADPGAALARFRLGVALRLAGRLDEALVALRQAHLLGAQRSDWRVPTQAWIREAERLLALDARLGQYVTGKRSPEGAEQTIDLARLCALRGHHAKAAGYWQEAFTLDEGVPADPSAGIRTEAARAALSAALGAEKRDALRWRRRAVDWLDRQYRSWHGHVHNENVTIRLERAAAQARAAMLRWRRDPALASIRDPDVLATYSERERVRCETIWTQVTHLLEDAD